MKRSQKRPAWLTPAVRRHIRRIAYEYQVREFGEEMARVNQLPKAERVKYLSEMIAHAESKGVSFVREPMGVTR